MFCLLKNEPISFREKMPGCLAWLRKKENNSAKANKADHFLLVAYIVLMWIIVQILWGMDILYYTFRKPGSNLQRAGCRYTFLLVGLLAK